jgi:AcrR family transcriptional regulator
VTSVDQIAVGISRRSSFRYFDTKEDVVVGNLVETGLQIRDALLARPATEGPWDALREAFEVRFPADRLAQVARAAVVHDVALKEAAELPGAVTPKRRSESARVGCCHWPGG